MARYKSLSSSQPTGLTTSSLSLIRKAAEYFQRILKFNEANGEIWGALGHCYLMVDELHKAYSAYQQALYHLANPRVTL
jgi:hypothetical protein